MLYHVIPENWVYWHQNLGDLNWILVYPLQPVVFGARSELEVLAQFGKLNAVARR